MSQGERFALGEAVKIAHGLCEVFGMKSPECMIVGSVRRRRVDIGDLDLIAPLPNEGAEDPLYAAIAARVKLRPRAAKAVKATAGGGLFEALAPEPPPPAPPELPELIGEEVEGLRPGFACASLMINAPIGDVVRPIGVQIHRYTHANRGWIQLMKTGPAHLGKWFLRRWKFVHGIPPWKQASIDGHLVDANGNVIHVPDETDCFRLAQLHFVKPEERDEWMRREGGA